MALRASGAQSRTRKEGALDGHAAGELLPRDEPRIEQSQTRRNLPHECQCGRAVLQQARTAPCRGVASPLQTPRRILPPPTKLSFTAHVGVRGRSTAHPIPEMYTREGPRARAMPRTWCRRPRTARPCRSRCPRPTSQPTTTLPPAAARPRGTNITTRAICARKPHAGNGKARHVGI